PRCCSTGTSSRNRCSTSSSTLCFSRPDRGTTGRSMLAESRGRMSGGAPSPIALVRTLVHQLVFPALDGCPQLAKSPALPRERVLGADRRPGRRVGFARDVLHPAARKERSRARHDSKEPVSSAGANGGA